MLELPVIENSISSPVLGSKLSSSTATDISSKIILGRSATAETRGPKSQKREGHGQKREGQNLIASLANVVFLL